LNLESKTETTGLLNPTSGRLNRDNIRNMLNKVYKEESKPVSVQSIKSRTSKALIFIYLGTMIVLLSVGLKYLSFETNLLLPGLLILIFAFLIGFSLTTKNVRKIYRSMSRFKDGSIPVYKTIISESRWQKYALVYAVLVSLVFIGAQNFSFVITSNNLSLMDETQNDEILNEITEKMIRLEDIILGEIYSTAGQNYRYVTLEINNTINYYNKNVYLIVQSYFAGRTIDRINLTLDKTDSIILTSIKIHDADDTTIKGTLKYFNQNGEHSLNSITRESVDDIYITDAIAKVISTTGIIYKSVEISVSIYNERIPKAPEVVSVIVSNPIIYDVGKEKWIKNNETIYNNEFWEVKFKFDILDQESEFDIKLHIDESEKDKAKVFAE
jgi:hypothetical protein